MVSTISASVARPSLLGAQRPRLLHVPEYVYTYGPEACDLARSCGLEPDEWQEFVVTNSLGERDDGLWAAGEVGLEVPRQNGKGGIDEIRELAGLFLLDEMLIVHSAHEFATAEEAFERMILLLEANTELWKRIKPNGIKRSHGQEGIYLRTGQRLRYRTRTKGGGRGWSADCVILDEAMHIPEAMHSALMPVLSAMPNPQLWYTGSAVDKETMEHGLVFAGVRQRAIDGVDPSLAYFGWSPAFESPDKVTKEAAADPEVWAQANPALGIRISPEWVEKELRSMTLRGFAVERLGVGDWPSVDGLDELIPLELWRDLEDVAPIVDRRAVAFDVSGDRAWASVAEAGARADGLGQVRLDQLDRGTGWVVEYVKNLADGAPIVCNGNSPAASLVPDFEDAGVEVVIASAADHAQACGMFFDGATGRALRHSGGDELEAAVRGAAQRPLGDAWAWSRKHSGVDISPLVAVTLARWGSATQKPKRAKPLAAWG